MEGLSAAQIVRIWERGAAQSPVERALTILAEVHPDPAALPDLPIGARDAGLLALREATFGGELTAVARCAPCGERLEFRVQAADLVRPPAAHAASGTGLRVGGVEVEIRPLTSRDLAAAAACADADGARLTLARRCVSARPDGRPADVEAMAEQLLPDLARLLEAIDPGAAHTLALHCPACGSPQEYDLDVAGFLWAEIEAEALRLLRDVHAIAGAYGWSESAILAMTPLRRRAYLELVVG